MRISNPIVSLFLQNTYSYFSMHEIYTEIYFHIDRYIGNKHLQLLQPIANMWTTWGLILEPGCEDGEFLHFPRWTPVPFFSSLWSPHTKKLFAIALFPLSIFWKMKTCYPSSSFFQGLLLNIYPHQSTGTSAYYPTNTSHQCKCIYFKSFLFDFTMQNYKKYSNTYL